MKMENLIWLASFFLGFVFIISGGGKLVFRNRFRDSLSALEIFPTYSIKLIATGLPGLEIVLGLLVLLGWRLQLTVSLLLLLLVIFLGFLVLFRLRGGKEIACGCFADFEHKTKTMTLIQRNILLIIIGLPVLLDNPQFSEPGWKEWLMATTFSLGIMLAWSLLNRLFETVEMLRAIDKENNNFQEVE